MNLSLFDTPEDRLSFMPFSFTRPLSEMRIGILNISEKWEKALGLKASYLSAAYLMEKFKPATQGETLYVRGNLLPTEGIQREIEGIGKEQALWAGEELLAFRTAEPFSTIEEALDKGYDFPKKESQQQPWLLKQRWEIFQQNAKAIEADFDVLTAGRESQPLDDPYTKVYGNRIFLEEGASVKAAILNSESGAIYLGKNSAVHEGAIIKGAFALCESAHVNMAAKIKGDTTVGPFSKVGGEVSNSVIFGYSNKGHDGFIGNTVMGEWCNLGADTNTSNLKNTYSDIKLWNYAEETYTPTGQQFCGAMIGDHSKTGINSMLNTGTVMGVSANVYGGDFQKTFVPSFSWGNRRYALYKIDKALETAELVMARRNKALDEVERRLLTAVFEMTEKFRK